MFEALITFAEEALFVRIGRMSEGSLSAIEQCHALVRLYLEFCEKNHGISRLLTGGALTGESRQLHYRIAQQMVDRHDGLAKPVMAYNYAPTLLSKLVMQLFLERSWCIGDDNLHGCEAP